MTVVALIPAKESERRIGDTVRAVQQISGVDSLLVIDDGSSDGTSALASQAGARVLRLNRNQGKAGAIAAGVAATPEADVYLLVDADLASTAGLAERLLGPVVADEADMTIAVFPSAGSKAGFGKVRDLSAAGIRRGTGTEIRAPLSGQRAIRADLLRSVNADRFGLETALTVDALRAGARVVEIELEMDHDHTGRSIRGFSHRANQGLDVVRALWPRLTTRRTRVSIMAVATVLLLVAMLLSAKAREPGSEEWANDAENVLIFGVPRLGLDDIDGGQMPTLQSLLSEGAFSATTVRTLSSRPQATEAYATLGAGSRIRAGADADQVLPPDAEVEGVTAAEIVRRRTGSSGDGAAIVVSAARVIRNAGSRVPSEPGLLGDTLRENGLRAAVVGNSDQRSESGDFRVRRPAAVAVMDTNGLVGFGDVTRNLLAEVVDAPYGLRSDQPAMLLAIRDALNQADVVVVDGGDTDRAGAYAGNVTEDEEILQREAALRATDRLLNAVLDEVDERTLVLIVGMTPPTRDWALTPTLAVGPGVKPGYLHSPSTKREGLITLTDFAPTILDALDVAIPAEMIGAPLRLRPGTIDVGASIELNDVSGGREGVFFGIAMTFIVSQAIFYILAAVVLSQRRRVGGAERFIKYAALGFAAWPLASFVLRIFPITHVNAHFLHPLLILTSIGIALLAGRFNRHALSPLGFIAAATVALLLIDIATYGRLQVGSLLGYSPHTAARFTGFGNTAFAVFAATAIVLAAVHVHHSPRRQEAIFGAGCMMLVVLVADGFPLLGSDVGGILTMVPVFGLTLYVMSGRRISLRVFALAGAATVAVLAAATIVDLLRPEDARSHLGNFVSSSGDESGSAWTTVARKWETNLRVFRRSQWTWMVPITAGYMVYVLVVARGWTRLLPEGSALRAGVVGTVVAGMLGWAVNDSGVVVAALVFVYVGPYLTLLALDGLEPAERLIEPGSDASNEEPSESVAAQ